MALELIFIQNNFKIMDVILIRKEWPQRVLTLVCVHAPNYILDNEGVTFHVEQFRDFLSYVWKALAELSKGSFVEPYLTMRYYVKVGQHRFFLNGEWQVENEFCLRYGVVD